MTTNKKPRRRSIPKWEYVRQIAGDLRPEFLLPSEGLAILGGRLETVRRTEKRVRLRQWLIEHEINSLPRQSVDQQALPSLPAPTPVLSRLNRSRVLPQLVPAEMPLKRPTLDEVTKILRQTHARSEDITYFLDLLAATGVSFKTAKDIVRELTGIGLSDDLVSAVESARRFWLLFSEGRARYEALVALKQVRRFAGDFGYFETQDLDVLLPRIILADHFQRREYLVAYREATPPRVDLYRVSGLGLCQHPFTSLVDPLNF